MYARNRWNRKLYKVIEMTDKSVTLQREDGTSFTIQKTEYAFSYFPEK